MRTTLVPLAPDQPPHRLLLQLPGEKADVTDKMGSGALLTDAMYEAVVEVASCLPCGSPQRVDHLFLRCRDRGRSGKAATRTNTAAGRPSPRCPSCPPPVSQAPAEVWGGTPLPASSVPRRRPALNRVAGAPLPFPWPVPSPWAAFVGGRRPRSPPSRGRRPGGVLAARGPGGRGGGGGRGCGALRLPDFAQAEISDAARSSRRRGERRFPAKRGRPQGKMGPSGN